MGTVEYRGEIIILKVGQDGLLIPGDLLAGVDELHLWSEGERIVVQPIASSTVQ